jgi:hypothetical protein
LPVQVSGIEDFRDAAGAVYGGTKTGQRENCPLTAGHGPHASGGSAIS